MKTVSVAILVSVALLLAGDAISGQALLENPVGLGEITSVAFGTINGRLALAVATKGPSQIELFDVASGWTQSGVLPYGSDVEIVLSSDGRLVTCSNNELRIAHLQAPGGVQTYSYTAIGFNPVAVALAEDGTPYATNGPRCWSPTLGTVSTGYPVGSVRAVAVTASSQAAAVYYGDSSNLIGWSPQSPRQLTLDYIPVVAISALTLHGPADLLALVAGWSSGPVAVYKVAGMGKVLELDGDYTAAVFSADGRTLACAGWGYACILDLAAGSEPRRVYTQASTRPSLAFSPDGRWLALGAGHQVHIADLRAMVGEQAP